MWVKLDEKSKIGCVLEVKQYFSKYDIIKNSGNQPEFQSSIKKRTVNQTVVCFRVQYR